MQDQKRKEVKMSAQDDELAIQVKVAFTNADSIVNKIPELHAFMQASKPDVLAIVESNCKENVSPAVLNQAGYNMVRDDNIKERRGGILVYIRDKFHTKPCSEMEGIASNFQESSWHWFYYNANRRDRCLMGIVYRKPNSTRENDEQLINLISRAAELSNEILILGDFNMPEIDWNNLTTRNKFNEGLNTPDEFVNALQVNGLYQHVDQVTRARGSNQPSLLDLFVTSRRDNVDRVQVLAPLGRSDHGIIHAEVLFPSHKFTRNDTPLQKRWNFAKGDYDKARELARNTDWNQLLQGKPCDQQYNQFVEVLHIIRGECVPSKQKAKQNHDNKKWFTNEASRLVKKKQKAWNQYKRAVRLHLLETEALHRNYLMVRRRTHAGLRRIKAQHEERLYQQIKENPKTFYSYCNASNKIREPIGQVRHQDGTLTNSKQEVATTLNKHFKSIYTVENDIDLIYANEFLSQLEGHQACPFTDCRHFTGPSLSTLEFDEQDIALLLQQLKPSKSPGPDELHPRLLSELAFLIAKPLTIIFRNSLRSGTVPNFWKKANVTAIHKKGSKEDAANYRPISLTCICSKVMETVVKTQIMNHLMENQILISQQHGFTQERSCLTNLLLTLEECSQNLDDKFPTDIVYLDFAKAFDTVPHGRLCHKILSAGINGEVLNWTQNFLTDRKQRVVVCGTASDWEDVLSGVPQGSVIGPTLFLIFINDLVSSISSKVQIFADDTKLYRCIKSDADSRELQNDLSKVQGWSEEWKLCFSAPKCQVLRVSGSSAQLNRPTYQLNGVSLQNVTEQRDLGIIVDAELEYDKQIKKCIQKAYASWHIIKRTFESLNPKMFTLLYKTYVRPHVEYCPQVWSPYKKGVIKKLERVQRTATRSVRGLQGLRYEERLKTLGLTTLEERRERGDAIEAHKILHNLHSVDLSPLFQLRADHSRRGCLTLYKLPHRTLKRGKSFARRVVNKWNKLTPKVKTSKTTNEFKTSYDKK